MSKETKIEFIANTKIYILMRFFKKKNTLIHMGKGWFQFHCTKNLA
jgi:hypothetical protein